MTETTDFITIVIDMVSNLRVPMHKKFRIASRALSLSELR